MTITVNGLAGREITLIIDETGDRKKGATTDYVKRQYIGNLGKIENGIVAVTAYGLLEEMTFPLIFEVYKPKEKLLEGDTYLSKPQIAKEVGNIYGLRNWIEYGLKQSKNELGWADFRFTDYSQISKW